MKRPTEIVFAVLTIATLACFQRFIQDEFPSRSDPSLPIEIASDNELAIDTQRVVSSGDEHSRASITNRSHLRGGPMSSFATSLAGVALTSPNSQRDYQDAVAKLQRAIRYEVEQKKLPAFSMAIVDDDRTVWADGFGFQDADEKIPATKDTVYRVGSVSKLFTDIAVMQLVEKEKLDLDAPVQTYFPEFKPQNPYGIPITLRQLMTHRSGLVRESPVGNYFDPTEPSLAATVASLNDTSLVYQPETKTKYSNGNI